MKRLRKTVSLLLAAVLSCSLLFSCADNAKEKDISKLPITPCEPVKYSSGFIKAEAERLYTVTEGKLHEVYGSTLPSTSIKLLKACFEDALHALEARGVSEDTAKKITDAIADNGEFIETLLSSAKEGEALPISSAAIIFGELTRELGVGCTSLLLHDILLIYCEYMEDRYAELYMKNPSLTYLFRESLDWQTKREGIKRIGDESFAKILRVLVSLSTVNAISSGGNDGFMLTLSSGELAVFLNTEGMLISTLALTNEDAEFIIGELGDEGKLPLFKAIVSAGDTERYASRIESITALTAKILSNFDKTSADALKRGERSELIRGIISRLDDGDIKTIESILGEENEEKYKQYFTEINVLDKYLNFKEETGTATANELKAAGAEDVESVLKAYIASIAPAFAYTVFGND